MAYEKKEQPEVNIGTAGHVDHGKTTLVYSLTGIWTSKHSEELKRGMTIKLGYADGGIYRCSNCPFPEEYQPLPECKECPSGSEPELLRRISYVDAPGHEILMTTMLSGAAIMDGALLVIAANEKCPQPQTFEHFKALEIIGIKNLIIVQNKVDVVSRERARESYNEIKRLIEGTWAENAPIIPISALKGANIDVLMAAIQKYIPTPERDLTKPPLMHIVRSFDVNKPGTPPEKLAGGVVGGTLSQGELKIGDEIVILPGMKVKKSGGREEYQAIYTEVTSLRFGEIEVEKALPGGLLAVGTKLDPSITKRDQLIGNVLTIPNNKLPIIDHIEMEYHLLERVVGAKEFITARPIQAKERLMITIGTALTKGVVERVSSNVIEISLSKPIVGISGSRAVFSREINGKWRLAGWGILKL
ncbi:MULTISPECIES: translation initiation factor IF-2 subunit gamma [Fervidicoccus]|uniref:protein-synthesizing GTPase n=2 Tax=Fervidicoccus fontis TaxID=683846 RepID=I0A0C8_FERFK|nr:translation initiation factor IF-2 subunit gamma [Fervidicoccus fontis]AFH42435.1 translation initiation factor IF-2 subunit gamma [Fervidicoccus fontis Kam940]PMB76069.1 MAG: translation initiation factor IF-2 subunit gamma [Fervidicoccus fontis]HEW63541.1 translation initiation factor IF-2 subunit gamma [Fervidicoccus fontis]